MSSIIDMFSAEDRVSVKFSQFHEMMRGCVERDIMLNAVANKIPHKYIYTAITGEPLTNKEDK